MNPEIKILEPGDWEAHRTLWLKALQTNPEAFGRSFEEEVILSDQEWQNKLLDPHFPIYGVMVERQLVAIASVKFEIGDRIGHMATIKRVYTDPEFRNQGLSTALLKKILSDLHDNPKTIKVRLSVNDSQVAAKKMYENLGFETVGLEKKEVKIGTTYLDQTHMELIFEDKL